MGLVLHWLFDEGKPDQGGILKATWSMNDRSGREGLGTMRISTFHGTPTDAATTAFRHTATNRQHLTGRERHLESGTVIVSKTDVKGVITYVNSAFLEISGYDEHEVLGAPHSVLRHPHMPRSVFKLLWDTIRSGEEVFAYVNNRARNGDHYWVFAHVTPTVNRTGEIVGFHSNRRAPSPSAIEIITPLYESIAKVEISGSRTDAAERGLEYLTSRISKIGLSYSEFLFSI